MRHFLQDWSFYFYQLRKNLKNQRALRLSFGLQILGMFLNNIAFFIIWLFFIRAIGVTNGWGAKEVFGLLSVSIFTFGLSRVFFGGIGQLGDRVITGSFDSFLTKPKSLYLRILNQDFYVSALGDLIQGALGIVIFLFITQPSLEQVLLLLVMIPPAILIHASFGLITDCVIFWFPQAEQLNRAFLDLLIMPSTQPIALLEGTMRFIYIFVVPALLLAGLPIQAFIQFDWWLVALAYGVAIGWLLLSKLILRWSLKKYESANFFG